MPTIPAAMLKQLYQRQSLRNTGTGWQFTIRNHLASANLIGLGLSADGGEVAPDALAVLQPGGGARAATGITGEAPLLFTVGVDTTVQVAGAALAPGEHTLTIRAETREIGTVMITVQDTLAG